MNAFLFCPVKRKIPKQDFPGLLEQELQSMNWKAVFEQSGQNRPSEMVISIK